MMSDGELAPTSVYRACLRGLKRYDRARMVTHDTGATAAALAFAETVADGFPVDAATAAEVVEAHRLLDEAPRRPDGETEQQRLSRLLWGGDDAVDWAERLVERTRTPLPDPTDPPADTVVVVPDRVAAAPADDLLERLSVDLFDLDTRTIDQLRSAFWVAYRTALRSVTSKARARSHRVPKAQQVAAGLDDQELNECRRAMSDGGPLLGFREMPDRVAAAIDLDVDTAVRSALDDYEEVAAGILAGSVARAARLIADRLGVDLTEIEALAPAPDSSRLAAGQLRADLLEWVREAFDVDRDPDEVLELTAPEESLAAAVSLAGGVVDDDEDSVSVSTLDRVLAGVVGGSIVAPKLGKIAGRFVERVWRWEYGDPSSRPHGPYRPHLRIRGVTWATPEERARKIGNARPRRPHKYCQCRIRRTWRLKRGDSQ